MRVLVLLLVLGCIGGVSAFAAPPSYKLTQLEKPEGVTDLPTIGAINDNGLIVGSYRKDGWARAFTYTDGVYTELPVLEGHQYDYSAVAVNNKGWVLGHAREKDAKTYIPVLWRDGKIERIPLPENVTSAEAIDINSKGQVLCGREQPFICEDGSSNLLAIKRCYYIAALNDAGTAVGNAEGGAFVRQNGKVRIIVDPRAELGPIDINSKGQVVAIATIGEVDEQRTYLWENGKTTDLGAMNLGAAAYRPRAINNDGIVVGYYETSRERKTGGYVWKDGVMVVLEGPGIPEHINNRGWIVGSLASVWKPVEKAQSPP